MVWLLLAANVTNVAFENGEKKGISHFGYKLPTIIDKDYELIRRFGTTTS